ncbi:SHUGOSHIN 2-like [Salvia miltiorrhiza]|uniref:SHUGOSHIN 2-like n=1 Tax=Salvia miltiorrhiza TaxID=226208 RepID=UPI0025AC5FEF|nr:SHUGOSHIN 2-like [Salvia miltiorrhiza]
MSERDGFLNLDTQNAAAIGCYNKDEKAARLCPQNLARRKLADISNLPQSRLLIQDQKSQSIPTTTKEYIEQLQKENLALAKMLAQRNKIIEQSGIELERLRSNLIKMREQNQQLALSHTLMLAELNSGKDRLKTLQHELGCKNGLLKARNSKLEVNLIEEEDPSKDHKKPRNAKKRLRSLSLGSSEQSQSKDNAGNRLPTRRQSARFKAVEPDDDSLSEMYDSKIPKCPLPDGTSPSTSVDALANNEDHVAKRPSVRRQSARFKAVTPCPIPDETIQENGSTSVETSVINEGHAVQRPSVRRQSASFKAVTPYPVPDETIQENVSTSVETSVINEGHAVQRPSARRQSPKFKAKRPKQADDLSEMDNTISTNCSSPVPENCSTSVDTSVKNEDDRSCSGQSCESQGSGKPSLGRPSRVAARKVQTYREIPVNAKMRRS